MIGLLRRSPVGFALLLLTSLGWGPFGTPLGPLFQSVARADEGDEVAGAEKQQALTEIGTGTLTDSRTTVTPDSTPPNTAEPDPAFAELSQPTLPVLAPDGRPFRAVEVFLSQLAELIPENFVPVSLATLNKAATELADAKSSAEAAQIRSAHYVIQLKGDTLVSDRSTIDIQYSGDQVTAQSLGKVNFAIDPLPTRSVVTNDSLPRLESHSDGSLSAFVDGDSNISFVWSLKGTQRGLSREFDLRIPRSPQTLIELATPRGVLLDVLDGVIRPLPAPPAGMSSVDIDSGGAMQWWRIDAGGLDLLRLRVRTVDESLDSEAIIVRRSSCQYEVDPGGVSWKCSMTVQFPARDTYPPLIVHRATVLSVTVDTVEVPITTILRNDEAHIVQMRAGTSTSPRPGMTATVNVTGFCSWDLDTGWCDLQVPNWLVSRVLQTASTTQAQLRIDDSLRMVSWQLPLHWRRSQPTSSGTATLFQAEGPPILQPILPVIDDYSASNDESYENLAATIQPPPSRVRLAIQKPLTSFDSAFAFTISEQALDAKARFVIKTDPQRIEPLEFKLEKNWKLLSLSLPISSRLLENPEADSNTNTITLWPEPNEIINGEIIVEATGRTRLPANKSSVVIPSSWFIHLDGVRGTMTAAMIAPGSLKWSGDTTMRVVRVLPESLTSDQASFFGTLPPEALLFRPEKMSTPTLMMQSPSVSFNITSLLEIRREGDEWVETLKLETDATNPLLKSLKVDTGPSQGRPPYRWLLRSNLESEPVSLPSTSIRFDEKDEAGTYQIDVSKRELGGKTLIGRRRYASPNQIQIQLPQVPEASSQNAEVLLGEGLEVRRRSAGVMRVPIAMPAVGEAIVSATEPVESEVADTDALAFPIPTESSTTVRLRYDPVDQPLIVIASTKFDPNVNLVWQKYVQVFASSRGTDAVELLVNVSATNPIHLTYSPSLILTSVYRGNTQVLNYESTPSSLTITPSDGNEPLRVHWTRNQSFRGWWRSCRIPKIEVSGIVVNERYTLVASADSFVPGNLLNGTFDPNSGETVCETAPESLKVVMHYNVVLGFGWLFALVSFAICWWIARRSATIVAGLITIAVTIAVLWSPWAIAVVGWFILPASAAVLLATSIEYRHWIKSYNQDETSTEALSQAYSKSDRSYSEHGFSFNMPRSGAVWWIVAILASWSLNQATAQTPTGTIPPNRPSMTPAIGTGSDKTLSHESENTKDPSGVPVTMIVPVDANGEITGDKVYVPESVRASLYQKESRGEPEVVRFQFADYRVKIEPTRDVNALTPPSVYAEYVVRIDRPTNRIILPLQSKTVRRVELVGPDDDRIVRFSTQDESSIIVNVPPANLYRLRVTLIPTVNVTTQGTQVDLAVPPINSARLTVDLDRGIESVSIEGATGRVVADTDLRRTVAHLGPSNRMVLRYVNRDRIEPTAGQSLVRRYWVQCGQNQTVVDCEITPGTPILNGQRLSLIIFDSAMPTLASPTWRIVVNEMLSPMRRQLTLTSLSDTPTPIRLLWNLPTPINEAKATEDRVSLTVPEISLLTSAPASPILVAIQNDPSLRVVASTQTAFEIVPPDQFLSGWTGYRDRIDQSFVATDRVPSLILSRAEPPSASVVSRHHLQVTTSNLHLRYHATFSSSELQVGPRLLKIPTGFELLFVLVNGVRIDSPSIQSGDERIVLLSPLPPSSPLEVDAMAFMPLSKSKEFSTQRFELWPPSETRDTYSVLRDASTRVETISAPLLTATIDAFRQANADAVATSKFGPIASRMSDAEILAAGWIPVSTWQIDEPAIDASQRLANSSRVNSSDDGGTVENAPAPNLPGGVFKATEQSNQFSTNQLIVMSWQDGRWSMATHIEIGTKKVPDFIDVEVPTRWCESLEVSPERTWSRQPSTNPLLQVVRIQCDRSLNNEQITIRGQLKTSDKGRISVPAVSVLGTGIRNILVSVPDRLTSDNISWRPTAVSKLALPEKWNSFMPASTTERSTYAAAGPGWSIELAALPVATTAAEVTGCETQVYFSNSFALILARWDLVPGGVKTIGVDLPDDAEVVSAWSASQPVHTTLSNNLDSSTSDDLESGTRSIAHNRKLIRVPLALDRLSQSVEVLYRVPSPRPSNGDYLAKLTNVLLKETILQKEDWVSVYSLLDTKPIKSMASEPSRMVPETTGANAVDLRVYALVQAISVVESVERSEDNLAERPADEILSWLVPWVDRYEALSRMVGRQVDVETLIAAAESNTTDETTSNSLATANSPLQFTDGIADLFLNASDDVANRIAEARWNDLDHRIGVFVDRFMRDQTISQESRSKLVSRFGVLGFDGYQRIGLTRVASGDTAPALKWLAEASEDPLRLFIANCLTVLLVLALLVLSWRFKSFVLHLVHHPATWLAVLAFCSFFVAPLPFAASLLLVAAVLPLMPRNRQTDDAS